MLPIETPYLFGNDLHIKEYTTQCPSHCVAHIRSSEYNDFRVYVHLTYDNVVSQWS